MTIAHDLGLWLWRLIPANPILVRVVTAGGRRIKHAWTRAGYLAVLILAMFWGGVLGGSGSLAERAKLSTQVFVAVSLAQLAMMCFIAPVFAAGAITQEKDGNTFNILLTTPLSNAQIVLGSLLSRLYFVWVLLLSGLPIFCISMIYGGVTTTEVFESFALAAMTAMVTGALAIMIGMAKVGSRRTIFSFLVGVAAYLLSVGLIGMYTPWGPLTEAPIGPNGAQMSWLAPVHPFLALLVVTGSTPAPAPSDVAHFEWPARWLLAYPQYGYLAITAFSSMCFIVASLVFVRRGQTEGEATLLNRMTEFFARREQEDRRRKPRRVWANPIAWREAATKASAGGRSLTRWVFIIGGVIIGIVLLTAARNSWWGINIGSLREWLAGLLWIEFGMILLVVTSTAASSLTREKESMTMELLLATRLTSGNIVIGMLLGLVTFVLPMISVPLITIFVFVASDWFVASKSSTGVPVEAVILAPVLMTAVTAVAAMIGMHFSLTMKKTIQAVMTSTIIVIMVSGLVSFCGFAMGSGSMHVVGILWPFMPFPAIQAAIDPQIVFTRSMATGGPAPSLEEIMSLRMERGVTCLISALLYAAITWTLHKSMVRNFDMTVRRQSA